MHARTTSRCLSPVPADPQRRTSGAAVHVVGVLEAVAAEPRGVPAKAVARHIGQSLSSTYYLLQALSELGFVATSPVSRGLYTLGPKIAELFRCYVASWTVPERLEPALLELRDCATARAYAGMWTADDLEITGVRGQRGASELHDVTAGFRGAAHALAIGKVLLAGRPPPRWPGYLRGAQIRGYTPYTITTAGRLHEELADVRAQGYAVDVDEYALDVCGVAAPIRDGSGRPIAALAVSVGRRRYERDGRSLIRTVRDVAASTSAMFADLDPLRDVVTAIASRPGL